MGTVEGKPDNKKPPVGDGRFDDEPVKRRQTGRHDGETGASSALISRT
jgi:hypothetical protein